MPLRLFDVNKEYQKNEDLKKEEVEEFLQWAHSQPHLPKINEVQAIIFLHCGDYKIEVSKTILDKFFTVKTANPHIFKDRNPFKSPVEESLDVALFTPLPMTSPEGYTVAIYKLIDTKPSNYHGNAVLKIFDMICMMTLHQDGPSKGYIMVIDMKGSSLGHMFRTPFFSMKTFMFYIQEAIPVKIVGIHYINIVPFVDKMMNLMSPFMKKDLMKLIHLHKSVDTLAEHFPIECLPKDYGGSAEDTSVLHEKIKARLCENLEFFQWEDEQNVDESQRPKVKKSWFGW